jgi:hypothetical protein
VVVLDFTVKQISENHNLREEILRSILRDPSWKHDAEADTVPLNLKDDLVESYWEVFSFRSILEEKRRFYHALSELRGEKGSQEALMLLEELATELSWRKLEFAPHSKDRLSDELARREHLLKDSLDK